MLVNVAALLGASSANGFQLVTSGAQSKAMSDFQIVNIQVNKNRMLFISEMSKLQAYLHVYVLASRVLIEIGKKNRDYISFVG